MIHRTRLSSNALDSLEGFIATSSFGISYSHCLRFVLLVRKHVIYYVEYPCPSSSLVHLLPVLHHLLFHYLILLLLFLFFPSTGVCSDSDFQYLSLFSIYSSSYSSSKRYFFSFHFFFILFVSIPTYLISSVFRSSSCLVLSSVFLLLYRIFFHSSLCYFCSNRYPLFFVVVS